VSVPDGKVPRVQKSYLDSSGGEERIDSYNGEVKSY